MCDCEMLVAKSDLILMYGNSEKEEAFAQLEVLWQGSVALTMCLAQAAKCCTWRLLPPQYLSKDVPQTWHLRIR